MDEQSYRSLIDLGLNKLEANIYVFLAQNPGVTGYKISSFLSKPVANTYKALNQMEKKGLVLCDRSSKNKIYHTIDIKEYLQRLENEFAEKKKKL